MSVIINGYDVNEPGEPSDWSGREYNLLSACAASMPTSGTDIVDEQHKHTCLFNLDSVKTVTVSGDDVIIGETSGSGTVTLFIGPVTSATSGTKIQIEAHHVPSPSDAFVADYQFENLPPFFKLINHYTSANTSGYYPSSYMEIHNDVMMNGVKQSLLTHSISFTPQNDIIVAGKLGGSYLKVNLMTYYGSFGSHESRMQPILNLGTSNVLNESEYGAYLSISSLSTSAVELMCINGMYSSTPEWLKIKTYSGYGGVCADTKYYVFTDNCHVTIGHPSVSAYPTTLMPYGQDGSNQLRVLNNARMDYLAFGLNSNNKARIESNQYTGDDYNLYDLYFWGDIQDHYDDSFSTSSYSDGIDPWYGVTSATYQMSGIWRNGIKSITETFRGDDNVARSMHICKDPGDSGSGFPVFNEPMMQIVGTRYNTSADVKFIKVPDERCILEVRNGARALMASSIWDGSWCMRVNGAGDVWAYNSLALGVYESVGAWRLYISGVDLLVQRLTVTGWVTKSTISGA